MRGSPCIYIQQQRLSCPFFPVHSSSCKQPHIQPALLKTKDQNELLAVTNSCVLAASCSFFDLIMQTTWSSIQIPALFTHSFMFTFQRSLYALWKWFNGSFVSASNRRHERQNGNIPKDPLHGSKFSVGVHHKTMSFIINISTSGSEILASRVGRDSCWFYLIKHQIFKPLIKGSKPKVSTVYSDKTFVLLSPNFLWNKSNFWAHSVLHIHPFTVWPISFMRRV